MFRLFACVFCILLTTQSYSQTTPVKPKLVVGIVVDQMRQEYLYRFGPKFGEGGFKRFLNDGFMVRNAHYNYVPTFTGPGHASVYTGSTPAIHGIIGNDWFDKQSKKNVNCVGDDRYLPVGTEKGNGDVSPSRLLTSTITDELKISTQMQAKVVGVSIKDRGAVLPAGHVPDGAYWFDSPSGKFISSTYYHDVLPTWVDLFNAKAYPEFYLSQEWKTLLPLAQYTESGPDDSPYEGKSAGKLKPVFPYSLKQMRGEGTGFDAVVRSPFGDDLLTQMAKAALYGEQLGKDEITDFLTISFSSPDIIGHAMGPQSVEIEDTYLRLDKNLKELFEELDKVVGAGKYLVFLTADHAVAEVPQYLKDNRFPADVLNMTQLEADLNKHLAAYFPGKKVIDDISNDQVFLNQELFAGDPKSSGIDLLIATELISKYLISVPGIAQVFSASVLKQADYGEKGIKGMMTRGFNHKRSGDVAFALEPGWVSWGGATGTTHGSAYTYDTNVPMLFYGAGIKKGSSVQYHAITDLAPTISTMLRIKFPSGCTGQPIVELFE